MYIGIFQMQPMAFMQHQRLNAPSTGRMTAHTHLLLSAAVIKSSAITNYSIRLA
jgi:hypothetical protein